MKPLKSKRAEQATATPRPTIPTTAPAGRLKLKLVRSRLAKSRGALKKRLTQLLQELWQAHGAPAAEVEVHFIDEPAMCALHEQFLQDPSPTDIITFDLGMMPGQRRLASLCICPAVAQRHARRFKTTLSRELDRLIIHGVLHLLGYEDHEPALRRRMRIRENEILAQLVHRPKPGKLST